MRRQCTMCKKKYEVESLENRTVCPSCGHAQVSRKDRFKGNSIQRKEVPVPRMNPAFYQPGDRVVLPSRIPGKVAVVFPSKVVDVDVEYLTDLLREVEETLKNNMGVEGV